MELDRQYLVLNMASLKRPRRFNMSDRKARQTGKKHDARKRSTLARDKINQLAVVWIRCLVTIKQITRPLPATRMLERNPLGIRYHNYSMLAIFNRPIMCKYLVFFLLLSFCFAVTYLVWILCGNKIHSCILIISSLFLFVFADFFFIRTCHQRTNINIVCFVFHRVLPNFCSSELMTRN